MFKIGFQQKESKNKKQKKNKFNCILVLHISFKKSNHRVKCYNNKNKEKLQIENSCHTHLANSKCITTFILQNNTENV